MEDIFHIFEKFLVLVFWIMTSFVVFVVLQHVNL